MTQPTRVDKLDPQDPARHHMQPPTPSHPPDTIAAGDADKVAGPDKSGQERNAARHLSTAMSSGPSMDQVAGPA
ncbi:MAG: hypothetical protein H7176_05570 [Bdellovibrionales bacterium]|nr:hypothetical protein [Massilia sp.]